MDGIGDLSELVDVDVEDLNCSVCMLLILIEPGSHGLARRFVQGSLLGTKRNSAVLVGK